MTYPTLFPYLKGFHLTLCAHLPGRDKEGWKRMDLEQIGHNEVLREKGLIKEADDNTFNSRHPVEVEPVPRFFWCLKALTTFFEKDSPPSRSVRKAKFHFLVYGFVDASKSGLGSTKSWGDKTTVRMGTWGADSKSESSNWREFTNLVEDLEGEENSGDLDNSWVILATDNATVKACMYKGNSSSPKLFDLIVRVHALEFRTGAHFLITHVAGKRMIAQGTDGVSRGSLQEGVCLGEAMTAYCPWGERATERSGQLLEWIRDWFGAKSELLEPIDWFRRGHDHSGGYLDQNGKWRNNIKSSSYIWDLAPVAAGTALEELRKARTKRRLSTHLVVVPKLFTPLWLKQLHKVCDLILFIPPLFTFWNENMYKPLCLGFCFPFLKYRPWQLKRAPKLLELGRQVHKVCKEDRMDPGNLLRKLLRFTRRLPTLPRDQLWSLLFFGRKDSIPNKKRGIHQNRDRDSKRSKQIGGSVEREALKEI